VDNDAEIGHYSKVATRRHLVTRHRFRIALRTIIAIVIGAASSVMAFEIDRALGTPLHFPWAYSGSGVVGFAAAFQWHRRERGAEQT
jgi:hypothetical protein